MPQCLIDDTSAPSAELAGGPQPGCRWVRLCVFVVWLVWAGLAVVGGVCAAPAAVCVQGQDSEQEARGRPGPGPSVGLAGLVPLVPAAAAVQARQADLAAPTTTS